MGTKQLVPFILFFFISASQCQSSSSRLAKLLQNPAGLNRIRQILQPVKAAQSYKYTARHNQKSDRSIQLPQYSKETYRYKPQNSLTPAKPAYKPKKSHKMVIMLNSPHQEFPSMRLTTPTPPSFVIQNSEFSREPRNLVNFPSKEFTRFVANPNAIETKFPVRLSVPNSIKRMKPTTTSKPSQKDTFSRVTPAVITKTTTQTSPTFSDTTTVQNILMPTVEKTRKEQIMDLPVVLNKQSIDQSLVDEFVENDRRFKQKQKEVHFRFSFATKELELIPSTESINIFSNNAKTSPFTLRSRTLSTPTSATTTTASIFTTTTFSPTSTVKVNRVPTKTSTTIFPINATSPSTTTTYTTTATTTTTTSTITTTANTTNQLNFNFNFSTTQPTSTSTQSTRNNITERSKNAQETKRIPAFLTATTTTQTTTNAPSPANSVTILRKQSITSRTPENARTDVTPRQPLLWQTTESTTKDAQLNTGTLEDVRRIKQQLENEKHLRGSNFPADSSSPDQMEDKFKKTAFNRQFFGEKNPDDYLLVLPLQFKFLRKDHPVWINKEFK